MTVQELYASIGGNYDSAKRILQMDKLISKFILKFLNDASFDKLATAWEAKDGAGIFDGAHALKGVCANLGLDALSASSSEICEEFRPGAARKLSDEALSARMDKLKADYARTIEGIRAFEAEQ